MWTRSWSAGRDRFSLQPFVGQRQAYGREREVPPSNGYWDFNKGISVRDTSLLLPPEDSITEDTSKTKGHKITLKSEISTMSWVMTEECGWQCPEGFHNKTKMVYTGSW